MHQNPKIIFENSDFLIIDKPAGLLVHPASGKNHETETLTDWLIENYPQIKQVGDAPELRPGIVHRLDKETSGVMIIAKTQEAFEALKQKFQTREIKKTYLGLALGKFSENQDEINKPIAKSKDSTKRTTFIKEGQKNSEAKTLWRKIQEYQDEKGQFLTLLELEPKTGRTHQLRVHLSAIGHPIAGDYLYGRRATKSFRKSLERIFLHAQSLEFNWQGEKLSFEAPLPKNLSEFLQTLKSIENV